MQWKLLSSLLEVLDTPVKKLSCADCKTYTKPFSLFVNSGIYLPDANKIQTMQGKYYW